MISAPLPANENDRLQKLAELGIMDTLEEQVYDDLTHLAAQICSTPIALVSLIDMDRQWFKSHHGLEARETPREVAFCAHAILQKGVFLVEDSLKDERFHDNPLATGAPHVRFYAGAPLIMDDNLSLGTLCVIDNEPRSLTPAQMKSLQALARQVISLLDLRMKVSELEILDRAKSEFIAMVNHELRTPLSSVMASLELLEKDLEPASEGGNPGKLIDTARRNTDRLLVIVNDILDIAKMEAGKFEIQIRPIDLVELLRNAVALNESFVKKQDCTLTLLLPDNAAPVMVEGDEQRLVQVLYNLISNAAKFSDPGGEVRVELTPGIDTAKVNVTDRGIGIGDEQMKNLFKKFHQLNVTGKGRPPGTGLGLSICKNILELHDSEIRCESAPGLGSTFHFTLRVADTGQ